MAGGGSKRRVEARDFEDVVPSLGISPERVEAARLVMVDGLQVKDVAARFDWTSQAVSICVRLVWRKMESLGLVRLDNDGAALPPGWERFSFIGPSSLVASVKKQLADFESGSRSS